MEKPQDNDQSGDLALIQAAIRGEDGAWERFLRRYSDLIYSFCHLVFTAGEVDEEYLNILRRVRADDFAILRAFNGRAKFSTYLQLKLSDLLASRIVNLFNDNADRAWKAFECFFKKDITRVIAKHFSLSTKQEALQDGSNHEDIYQEICFLLIEQGYRRIMTYGGHGSFTGYVRRIVENLCMDLFRKTEGRRRIPEGILRLPELEQEVFKLLHWSGCGEGDLFHILRDDKSNKYSADQVEQAISRVREVLSSRRSTYKGYGEERPGISSLNWLSEDGQTKQR